MDNEAQKFAIIFLAIYFVVMIIGMAINKALNKENDERAEEYERLGAYYSSKLIKTSSDYTPFIILWPLALSASPFYGIYKLAYWITRKCMKK